MFTNREGSHIAKHFARNSKNGREIEAQVWLLEAVFLLLGSLQSKTGSE